MKRKPVEKLVLRQRKPLTAIESGVILSSREIVSHLPRLDVEWRLYRVQMSNGFGPFGNSVRFMVEGTIAEQPVLAKAA